MQRFASVSAHRGDPAALRKLEGMFSSAQHTNSSIVSRLPVTFRTFADYNRCTKYQEMLLLKFQTDDARLSQLVTAMFSILLNNITQQNSKWVHECLFSHFNIRKLNQMQRSDIKISAIKYNSSHFERL